jgi:molybdopterin converting factor small subunit
MFAEDVEITVTLLSLLADLAGGQKRVTVRGATVREALLDLGRRYPALGRTWLAADGGVNPALAVHLNGRDLALPSGLDTPVHVGDELALLPVVAGG